MMCGRWREAATTEAVAGCSPGEGLLLHVSGACKVTAIVVGGEASGGGAVTRTPAHEQPTSPALEARVG